MALTPTQKTTLKAHIAANAATVPSGPFAGTAIKDLPQTSDANFEIAAWYNALASPTFYIWRATVNVADIMQNGFGWDRVDNLTVGKARIWDFMTRAGTLDPSRANVRAGFLACFSAAGDQTTRQAIADHSQRAATRIEQLFSTGSGTASTDQFVGPAITTFLSTLSYQDVDEARNS